MVSIIAPLSVAWQVRVHSAWVDIDASIARTMEAHFKSGSTAAIYPLHASGTSHGEFSVENMKFGGADVRRCRSLKDTPEATMVTVKCWADHAWMSYDEYVSCLIIDAIKAKREKIRIMVHDSEYDCMLKPPHMMQISVTYGTPRPILVTGPILPDDDSDGDGVDLEDDDKMPAEFKCPITTMPMKRPVVAADGHSYERKSIRQWFLTKQTSPVTGKALMNTELRDNLALKKLMIDYATTKAEIVEKNDGDDEARHTEKRAKS